MHGIAMDIIARGACHSEHVQLVPKWHAFYNEPVVTKSSEKACLDYLKPC